MKIRAKALFIIGLSAVCLIVFPYLQLQRILGRSVQEMETQAAMNSAAIISSAIEDELGRMLGSADDWAAWSETHDFLSGVYPSYPAENLTNETFNNLQLNAIVYLTLAGSVFHEQGYDLHAQKKISVSEEIRRMAQDNSILLGRMKSAEGTSGIVLVGNAPVFFACRPVLRNDRSGPIAGVLLIARNWDSTQTLSLANKLEMNVQVFCPNKQSLPALDGELNEVWGILAMSGYRRNETTLSTYGMLHKLAGETCLALRIEMPRAVYAESLSNAYAFILSLLPTVILFSVLTMALFEHLILSRLAKLTKKVICAGKKGDYSARLSMRGQDEVAALSQEISRMLEALSELHQAAQDNELTRRRFIEGASHELKTPLAALLGMVETLQRGAADEPTRAKFLGRIREQALNIASLVNSLLAFSRADAGSEVLRHERIDLCEALYLTVEAVRPLALTRGLELELSSPPAQVLVEVDREAFLLIIKNIIDNAVKYTPPGGRINARCREEGDEAIVEISDTGIGIPPEYQQRIFDRFFRVEKARSRELGGTGLGLSIANELVNLLDGKLSVSSEPGKGSTFTVRLPLAKKSPP